MGEERERITTEVAEYRRGNGETGMGFECVAIEVRSSGAKIMVAAWRKWAAFWLRRKFFAEFANERLDGGFVNGFRGTSRSGIGSIGGSGVNRLRGRQKNELGKIAEDRGPPCGDAIAGESEKDFFQGNVNVEAGLAGQREHDSVEILLERGFVAMEIAVRLAMAGRSHGRHGTVAAISKLKFTKLGERSVLWSWHDEELWPHGECTV